MKYCKKCKHIHNDEEQNCISCRRPLYEIDDKNTPVYLLSASGFELSRVKTALVDNGIPCDAIAKKKNISSEIVTGYNISDYDLLVPFSAHEKAYDLCVGIGAVKEENTKVLESEFNDDSHVKSSDEEFEEMSGTKRTAVRIISAIILIVIFCGVIWSIDALLNFFKGLF